MGEPKFDQWPVMNLGGGGIEINPLLSNLLNDKNKHKNKVKNKLKNKIKWNY